MDDSFGVVETHENLHKANLSAAKYFIEEYGGCFDYETPEFSLSKDGCLSMSMETDGSTGGFCTVYVQKSRLVR